MIRNISALLIILSLFGCAKDKLVKEGLQNIPTEMELIYEKALTGDAESQELIGNVFHYGEHEITKDYSKAFKWYNLAARQGYESSQNYLGLFYAGGLGVKEDCGESIKWFKYAYFNGYKTSKGNLVWMLATCREDSMRDGKLALTLAIEDLKENGTDIKRLDNLAASLAENSKFEDAIKIQAKLVSFLEGTNQKNRLEEHRKRLTSYKNKKAWRGASYDEPDDFAK